MLLASIIAIILFGIILLVVEILILPGLIAGIIGAVFMILGIVMMYKNFGDVYGNVTIVCTVVLTVSCLVYALKSNAWRRFGLKEVIDSKVIDLPSEKIEAGIVAITISALRPMGTVMIDDKRYEAQTAGEYIESNNEVVIVKVMSNKLLVRLKRVTITT